MAQPEDDNGQQIAPCRRFVGSRPPLVNAMNADNTLILDSVGNPIPIRIGEYGYFTVCQDGQLRSDKADWHNKWCDAGYDDDAPRCGSKLTPGCTYPWSAAKPEIRCTGAEIGIENCPDVPVGQNATRRVCRRNFRNFRTELRGTTYQECCFKLPDQARQLDCPFYAFFGSPYCDEGAYQKLVDDCLGPGGDPLGTNCFILGQPSDKEGADLRIIQYINVMKIRCHDENFIGHPSCVALMSNFPEDTFDLRVFLRGFCNDKVGSTAWRNVCACFYPDDFYDQLRTTIAKFYDVPDAWINQGRQCLFPDCHNSPLKDDPNAPPCEPLNIQQCIQNITITSQGDISNIVIRQDAQCGAVKRRDTCDVPCVAPEQCVAGVCLDPTKCTQDNDCGVNGDKECKDGVCVDKKTNWFKIIGIFLGVVAVICVGFGVYKLLKKRSAQAAKTLTPAVASVQ